LAIESTEVGQARVVDIWSEADAWVGIVLTAALSAKLPH